jgi:RNA polymerase sigma-70 factor (ECF subfamily)
MSEDTATTETTQPAPADLDQLWRRFSSDLRTFIARRVSRPEDADDILSIVFLRMVKSLDNLREQDRILGWMYAITRNAITDYYRSAPHRRELAVDTVPDTPPDGERTPTRRRRRNSPPAWCRCSPGCPPSRPRR